MNTGTKVKPASVSPTLRDQFAMAALTGLVLASSLAAFYGKGSSTIFQDVAEAYEYADLMMKEGEKSDE